MPKSYNTICAIFLLARLFCWVVLVVVVSVCFCLQVAPRVYLQFYHFSNRLPLWYHPHRGLLTCILHFYNGGNLSITSLLLYSAFLYFFHDGIVIPIMGAGTECLCVSTYGDYIYTCIFIFGRSFISSPSFSSHLTLFVFLLCIFF